MTIAFHDYDYVHKNSDAEIASLLDAESLELVKSDPKALEGKVLRTVNGIKEFIRSVITVGKAVFISTGL